MEKSDARIFRWIYNISPEGRISADELTARLKLKSMRNCLQDRRLQWFGHLERMEKSAWSIKCRTFMVSGSFSIGQPRKTWNDIIRIDRKERKVSWQIVKDRNC